MELSPSLILKIIDLVKDGGLAVALVIALLAWQIEVRRSMSKDKADAEFKEAILKVLGEVKTTISNGNILLDMLTRGRK